MLPEHIPDYMMNFYVESADVLVLPYDIKTSMNSGVMLLAFTNKRTVIVSDICMTEEFNDGQFYRYSYADDEDHIVKLTAQMEKAYMDGRAAVRKKGESLYEEILKNNLKKNVKKGLYKILEELPARNIRQELVQILDKEYQDKELWRRRYTISDAWLRNVVRKYVYSASEREPDEADCDIRIWKVWKNAVQGNEETENSRGMYYRSECRQNFRECPSMHLG